MSDLRMMGPLKADHPLVKDSWPCPVCNVAFKEDNIVTLITTVPASPEDALKAQQGRAHNCEASVVHWHCRGEP